MRDLGFWPFLGTRDALRKDALLCTMVLRSVPGSFLCHGMGWPWGKSHPRVGSGSWGSVGCSEGMWGICGQEGVTAGLRPTSHTGALGDVTAG